MSVHTFSNRHVADCRMVQGIGAAKPPAGSRSTGGVDAAVWKGLCTYACAIARRSRIISAQDATHKLHILMRGFQDPHRVLGVEPGADDKQVKRAYKKLALKFHPDVSEDELAEAKFRGLREAYELLMGKGDPGRESRAPFGGNWEFHDWYWSFSMRQRQRRQNPETTPQHTAAAAQKHKPNVMSQLQGLKARAAQRSCRDSERESFVQEEDVTTSSASDVTVEAPAAATHFSPGPSLSHAQPQTAEFDGEWGHESARDDEDLRGSGRSWSGLLGALEAHMSRHDALEAALCRHHVAVAHCRDHFQALQQWAQSRWGFRGTSPGRVASEPHSGPSSQAHVPFQHLSSPHAAPPRRHASAPTPLYGAAEQHMAGGDHSSAAAERSSVSVLVTEPPVEEPQDAPGAEREEQYAGGRSSRFQSSDEGRSAVSAQLAGLRRKAKLQERV